MKGRHANIYFYMYINFLQITQLVHVSENETLRKHNDDKDHKTLPGCFYRGHVRGDDRSQVTVSLCDGMVIYLIDYYLFCLYDGLWLHDGNLFPAYRVATFTHQPVRIL